MCNVPGYGIEEVADTTLCLILNLYRRTYWLATMLREGKKVSGPESLRDCAQVCIICVNLGVGVAIGVDVAIGVGVAIGFE